MIVIVMSMVYLDSSYGPVHFAAIVERCVKEHGKGVRYFGVFRQAEVGIDGQGIEVVDMNCVIVVQDMRIIQGRGEGVCFDDALVHGLIGIGDIPELPQEDHRHFLFPGGLGFVHHEVEPHMKTFFGRRKKFFERGPEFGDIG